MRTDLSRPTGPQHEYMQYTGDKASPSNYRPVSLTCTACKVVEHIVCSRIGRHIDNNITLHPNQHGFRKGLFGDTQLVNAMHELAYSINQKTQTDVIFLDFSKAFDKVSHDERVCLKSVSMGEAERPIDGSEHSSVLAVNK